MAWLEITVNTAPGTAEDIAAQLTAGGFSDLVIEDQAEFETFLDQNKAYWDYIDEELQEKLEGLSQVKLYLEDTDTQGLARLKSLTEKLGLTFTANAMADTDWSESWKDNYPPVEVGDRFVVLPYWLAEGDYGHRLPVILDPGLTFGTGAHPSTQMVMDAMTKAVKPGSRCLDLGSGSGILSIAALRLGARVAVGVDIDPKAETIAAENAGYNGFSAPVFTALTGNVTTDKPLMQRLSQQEWDVVLVNIVADVIIGLAPVLPQFLTDKSVLICSGILDVRLPEVIAALEKAGLSIQQIRSQEDWRCVVAKGAGL
ncbi:MAG: 50S ribosomal protein L11 methyltransferase [Oscillospiraceae bacterium]|nr:50S ribosomal protein L11 methyltransferase [Oscillospiraceae bacterium]